MCLQMKKYYDFRIAIRGALYSNDTLIGDLCCKILEIRDKYRFVESLSVAIQDFLIEIEVEEDTDIEKKKMIVEKICTQIGYFISNNINKLPDNIRNDPDFETFIDSENFIYCDTCMVGNSIKITL